MEATRISGIAKITWSSSPAVWCATFEACTAKSPRDSKRCARASESDSLRKKPLSGVFVCAVCNERTRCKGWRPGGSAQSCRECAAAKRKCTHNCPGRLPTGSGKGGAPAGLAPGSNSSIHDQQPPPNPSEAQKKCSCKSAVNVKCSKLSHKVRASIHHGGRDKRELHRRTDQTGLKQTKDANCSSSDLQVLSADLR